jgi:hypothetical protein
VFACAQRGGESERECVRRARERECHACVYVQREIERGRESESERASERASEMLTLAINTPAIFSQHIQRALSSPSA